MKIKTLLLLASTFFIGCLTGPDIPIDKPCEDCPPPPPSTGTEAYSGIRSSYYGFDNFPTPQKAATVMKNIAKKIGGTPSAVWIVGGIQGADCNLEFPNETGKKYNNITFRNEDKHESYLQAFDDAGIKVFLQVEAGLGNMKELIDLVMGRYGRHKSVAGFGIDVEWYPNDGETKECDGDYCWSLPNGEVGAKNKPMPREEIEELDNYLKTKWGSEYRLFVKHWFANYCGSSPVSDVIYINDSQGTGSSVYGNFSDWADEFAPNDVGFQIGYGSDEAWWSEMDDPMQEITDEIKNRIKNKDQKIHIYWVDFTIQNSMFDDLWN